MSNIYSVWFHQLNLSEYVKKQLLLLSDSCETLYHATREEYSEWGLNDKGINIIMQHKQNIDCCEHVIRRCEELDTKIIDFYNKDYPWLLREIPDSPALLYVNGNQEVLNMPMVAIVGSRKCSEYGYNTAQLISEKLSENDICVVSGLAMGIDGAAHFGALQNSITVGILGTGTNICYPACNSQLYRKIIENGCVVSEYPPDTPPRQYHFPKRNRIISGMCYGVVVIEAAQRSGSLITAQLALDYSREVYAVPGNIDSSLSEGSNTLIKHGAHCITCADDIIKELPEGLCIKKQSFSKNKNKLNNELAEEERIVYANVSQQPIIFDKILESTKLSCERINTSLLQLEIKGLIKRLPGERYVRI